MRTVVMSLKVDMGLAVGVEKLAGAGLLGSGGSRKADKSEWTPTGRYGAVAPVDGRIGTDTMPGVFAQIGMEYGHKYGGTSFELFARISEKNHAHSTLNPLAAYNKAMSVEQIMGDVMIAYPNTRPMCSANCDGAAAAVVVNGAKLKTLSLEQQRRAVKVSASVLTTDPWKRPADPRRRLPLTGTPPAPTSRRASAPTTSTSSSCTTASPRLVHYDNLMLGPEGGAVDFFESGATWRTGSTPVNVSGGLESKGHPIAATGIANVWEVCHHLRGEAGDRQIEGAKVGLAHVIGLGSACGVRLEASGFKRSVEGRVGVERQPPFRVIRASGRTCVVFVGRRQYLPRLVEGKRSQPGVSSTRRTSHAPSTGEDVSWEAFNTPPARWVTRRGFHPGGL
jgi:acetyl-CoA acetyltransferase